MFNIRQKIGEIQIHIFIVGIIFSIALSLAMIDFNKRYIVETTVILLPKSETAAVQLEKITNNVAAFPRMLSFYDRLLADNPQLVDPMEGQSGELRQGYWKTQVATDTKRFSRSSLVTLKIKSGSQNTARTLSSKSLQTLFAMTSTHYNTRTELELKVVNGPIVKAEVPFVWLIILVGITMGFGLALLLEKMLQRIEKTLSAKLLAKSAADRFQSQLKAVRSALSKPQLPEIESLEDIYKEELAAASPKKEPVLVKEEAVSPEVEALHQKKQEQTYPNFPEMPVRETKKVAPPENLPFGSAPNNLPIAETDYKFIIGKEDLAGRTVEADVQQDAPKEEEPKKEEPTAEELKKRLNQLLKGDM